MSERKGAIKNMGMLDLTSAKTAEELSGITSMENVGVVLVPEHLTAALAGIPSQNVGSVVPVPQGAKMNLQVGQTRLSGEALAAGPEDAILVLVGQIIITTPVEQVGYKELRVVGQLLAPRGSETALGAKLANLTGQAVYYPEGARLIMGSETLSREALESLTRPTPLMVEGRLTIEDDVTPELLRSKVPEIMLTGIIEAPKALWPALRSLMVDSTGRLVPKGSRFITGKESFGAAFLELLPEAVVLVVTGKLAFEDDVTVELLRSKVSEVYLTGKIKAPKALVPHLQILAVDKTGQIEADSD